MAKSKALKVKRATIRDVASLANVSISTVSHVFSGSRPISEKTKQRVRIAALELNYQPDPSARSLRSSKVGIIGFILRPKDAIHGTLRGTETFQSLLSSVATHALEQGRGLIHVPDVLDTTATNVAMDVCIVAHPYENDKVIETLLARNMPIVMIDSDPSHPNITWAVDIDYAPATATLLDAMYSDGRRRIAYISGTELNSWNRLSVKTYLEWCETKNLPPQHVAVFEGAGIQGAIDVAQSMLDTPHAPDAILTGPSTFARGVAEVASGLGIGVPDQLTIATLTDSELSRSCTPPLTAMTIPMEKAAAEAVRLAISLADGGDAPTAVTMIQPKIIWRESLSQPEQLAP